MAERPTMWRDRTAGEAVPAAKVAPYYLHWYLYAFRSRFPRIARRRRRSTGGS